MHVEHLGKDQGLDGTWCIIILQSHEIAVEENFIMKMLLDHELQQRRYRSHDVTYYHNMHELCAFQKAKVASQTRLSYLKKAAPNYVYMKVVSSMITFQQQRGIE